MASKYSQAEASRDLMANNIKAAYKSLERGDFQGAATFVRIAAKFEKNVGIDREGNLRATKTVKDTGP